MFQFPAFALHDYVFIMQYLTNEVGFPIQTPSDQSLFASSPKLFAGYHVFLRLLLPRHPPYALNILVIYPKMSLTLADTPLFLLRLLSLCCVAVAAYSVMCLCTLPRSLLRRLA